MFGIFKRKQPQSETPPPPPPPPQPPEGDGGDDSSDGDDRQEFIAKIPAFAEMHVSMSKDNFEVALDYSAESLTAIDEIIAKHWEEPPIMLDQVVLTFGAYVGETIRRQLGGAWMFDEERGYTLADLGGTGTRIYPFSKVQKRFTNGEEDSIAFFYQAICKLVADRKAAGENP